MINKREIRLGNWYMHDGHPMPLDESDLAIIFELETYDDFKPIELSAEILEKAGFERNRWETSVFSMPIFGDYSLEYNEGVISFVCEDSFYNQNLPHIKYLHQLQNLVYALSFVELDTKL